MKREAQLQLGITIGWMLITFEAFAVDRYPLGPGMRWTYRQQEGEAAPVEVQVEVTAALGAGQFVISTPATEEGTLVQVEGQKVFSITNGPAGSLRTLVLDFERAQGESWTMPCDGEALVEATNERVEVPAGVFEGCFRVRTLIRCLPGLGPSTVWYAPGVGRIKSELDGLDGPVRQELIEFQPLEAFTRGEINRDGKLDLSDAVFILRWLFLGEVEPACSESADADRDGSASLTDAVYVLRYLFLAGPPPAPPFPACSRTDVYELACSGGGEC